MLTCKIAKLDKRIGNCTVLACNKWHEIFKECEKSLGVSGDATNDVFSAWNKLASDAFHRRTVAERRIQPHSTSLPPRRSNSLTGLNGKTVKVLVQLIPLERARALTSGTLLKDEAFLASIRSTGRHLLPIWKSLSHQPLPPATALLVLPPPVITLITMTVSPQPVTTMTLTDWKKSVLK